VCSICRAARALPIGQAWADMARNGEGVCARELALQKGMCEAECKASECVRPAGCPASLEPLCGAPAALYLVVHPVFDFALDPNRPTRAVGA
jgi:hypothetical protein